MQNLGSCSISYIKYSPSDLTQLYGKYVEEPVLVARAKSKHTTAGERITVDVWVAGRQSTPTLAAAARIAIMEDSELIGGMPYKYTQQGRGFIAHLMLGVSYSSADEAVCNLLHIEEELGEVVEVSEKHLRSLTPDFLLLVANEARDAFETLDSYPTSERPYDHGVAEETAELLEELVRVRAPQHAKDLHMHMEDEE